MSHIAKFTIGAAALAALAGCVEDTGGSSPGTSPSSAEQACLSAVIRETGNSDASVGRSSFSEAGTEVIVAVGPQQAAWQCIAYSDGTTSRPMSLTDEGAL